MKHLALMAAWTWLACAVVYASPEHVPDTVPVTHAKGFSIRYVDGLKYVTVHQPWRDAKRSIIYVLYPRDKKAPYVDADHVIPVPIKSCAVLSSTYLPHIDLLGESQSVKAIDHAKYINTPSIRAGLKSEAIVEVGEIMKANLERVAALSPEVIFSGS